VPPQKVSVNRRHVAVAKNRQRLTVAMSRGIRLISDAFRVSGLGNASSVCRVARAVSIPPREAHVYHRGPIDGLPAGRRIAEALSPLSRPLDHM
jgi:hypothetical protein